MQRDDNLARLVGVAPLSMLYDRKERAGLVRGRLRACCLAGLCGLWEARRIICRERLSERLVSGSFVIGPQRPKNKESSQQQQQRESGKLGSRNHLDLVVSLSSDFHVLPAIAHVRVQHEALRHRELRRNSVVGVARQCKWDERQYWHASGSLRTGDETLPRLVPTQGEQDFLTLSDSSQRGFPDVLPMHLEKNRYEEL